MKNKAGEKEMRAHMKDVKAARKTLEREIETFKSGLHKKIGAALKQDARVLKDMKKADRKG